MTRRLAVRCLIAPAFLLAALASVPQILPVASPAAAQEEQSPAQQVQALKAKAQAGDTDALRQLETLAQSSPQAMAAMGDLYAGGGAVPADPGKAAEYYSNALSRGNKSVRTRLGVLYRDGDGLPANPERALELLGAGAAEGDGWAMFHLAQGHLRNRFGRASRPAEGVKMLEEAIKAGNPQAPAALANLYMWGNGGVARDPKRAIALLEEAADKGNAVAARNLVSIYRDGRGKLVPKDPGRAAALLDKYATLFDTDALATEKLLNDSSRSTASTSRDALAESYRKSDPAARRRMLLSLRSGNPVAYVFLVQDRLRAAGKYSGNVNGQLTRSTIAAINSFCEEKGITRACRMGPLSIEGATALADALN